MALVRSQYPTLRELDALCARDSHTTGLLTSSPSKANPTTQFLYWRKPPIFRNRSSGKLDVLTFAYARAGWRKDALRLLAELKRRKQVDYVPAGSFVIAYIGLSEYKQAFAWLEQAYQEHSAILQFLNVHPLFDTIRNDGHFADLVLRVGLQ